MREEIIVTIEDADKVAVMKEKAIDSDNPAHRITIELARVPGVQSVSPSLEEFGKWTVVLKPDAVLAQVQAAIGLVQFMVDDGPNEDEIAAGIEAALRADEKANS